MRRATALALLTFTLVAASIVFPATSASGGGGCHVGPTGEMTQGRAAAGETVTATIAECAFEPTVLYVDEGQTVRWVNKDIFDHTVTGAAMAWGSERFLAQGDTIAQKFTRTGVFPYYCLLHPGMVGTVVVGDPDPSDVALDAGTMANVGVEAAAGDGDAGSGDAAAEPISDTSPASDSLSPSILLGTIALLGLAGAVAVILVRRRGRVEQGV